MKIDFFQKISIEHPEDAVLCINNFEPAEVFALSDQIQNLCQKNDTIRLVCPNKQGKSTTLEFILGHDRGITHISDNHFRCELSRERYIEMQELLKPFTQKGHSGFQYLYDLLNPIDLVLSHSGNW